MGQPGGRAGEAVGEQADVEPQVGGAGIHHFFLGGEQVEQERAEPGLLEPAGDGAVARAEPAAAAAMRE